MVGKGRTARAPTNMVRKRLAQIALFFHSPSPAPWPARKIGFVLRLAPHSVENGFVLSAAQPFQEWLCFVAARPAPKIGFVLRAAPANAATVWIAPLRGLPLAANVHP
jgi:hypothetical protein